MQSIRLDLTELPLERRVGVGDRLCVRDDGEVWTGTLDHFALQAHVHGDEKHANVVAWIDVDPCDIEQLWEPDLDDWDVPPEGMFVLMPLCAFIDGRVNRLDAPALIQAK